MEYILHLIVILMLAYLAGRFFEKIRLTKIIGYILVGLLAGPSLLNWYTQEIVVSLDPLIIFSLTMIAFVYMTARILPQISELVMAIVLASIVNRSVGSGIGSV